MLLGTCYEWDGVMWFSVKRAKPTASNSVANTWYACILNFKEIRWIHYKTFIFWTQLSTLHRRQHRMQTGRTFLAISRMIAWCRLSVFFLEFTKWINFTTGNMIIIYIQYKLSMHEISWLLFIGAIGLSLFCATLLTCFMHRSIFVN